MQRIRCFYARAMYRNAQKELREWKPDLIVPVPVHRSKERQRGFNQAAYLAEKLGHYTGISTDVNIVQKVLKTKSQKKLNALQRRKNLEKAFCVTGDVRGKNILVIDDVYTTGSTIDAMGRMPEEKRCRKCLFSYGLHRQEIRKNHFSYIMIYVTINLYDYMNDIRLLLRTE